MVGTSIPAQAMSESRIKDQLVGKTVTFYHNNKDKEIIRFFDPNGTLLQTDEDDNFRRGHWAIDDGKLCFAFEGDSAKCRKFIKKKGKYGTSNKQGKKLIVEIESSVDGNQIQIPESEKNTKSASAFREELVTLDTRKNVTDTFLLLEPTGRKPRGVVLLLPGHHGVLHFKKFGDQYIVKNEKGGLTAYEKTPILLGKAGFVVALVTTPSDSKSGIDTYFRRSDKHAADINSIISYLNDRYKQKVNLWGHCLSTVSPPAIIAHNNNQGVAGMILSSARTTADKGTVYQVKGEPVRVRTLLVHHKEDPCNGTPYKNVPKLMDYYKNTAPEVDLISVSGGSGSKQYSENGCAGGHHGFSGRQKPVIKAVIKWLEHKPAPEEIN
jgi:hypothetical protein